MDLKTCRHIALALAALGLLAPAASARQARAGEQQENERGDKSPRVKEPGAADLNSNTVPDSMSRSAESRSTGAAAQAESKPRSDRQLASEVRRSIQKDDTLSDPARHVKVDAQAGMVTLTGTARSEAEKSQLEQKATAIAGADKVRCDVKVDPQAKF